MAGAPHLARNAQRSAIPASTSTTKSITCSESSITDRHSQFGETAARRSLDCYCRLLEASCFHRKLQKFLTLGSRAANGRSRTLRRRQLNVADRPSRPLPPIYGSAFPKLRLRRQVWWRRPKLLAQQNGIVTGPFRLKRNSEEATDTGPAPAELESEAAEVPRRTLEPMPRVYR
jgi:hypothetical protein